VVIQNRYVGFQMAEVAVPRTLFAELLRLIAELRPRSPPFSGRSIASKHRWRPDGRGASMTDRELPNAATKWGASLMTRVYAVCEAGSSPRRLASSSAMTQHRASEDGYPENPGSVFLGAVITYAAEAIMKVASW
jgi:hypothetical protein